MRIFLHSLLILSVLAMSTFSAVGIEVYVKPTDGNPVNSNQVQPNIKIINTGTNDINFQRLTVDYYIYEPTLDISKLSWRCDWGKVGDNYNMTNIAKVEFSRMVAPHIDGDKKSDIRCRITFDSPVYLIPGYNAEFYIAFFKNDWNHNFNQQPHWSYNGTYSYIKSEKIAVGYDGNTVLNGGLPIDSFPIVINYPQNCGPNENMKIDGFLQIGNKTMIDSISIVTDTIKGTYARIDGQIKTRQLVVTRLGWADYVLKNGYNLMPLSKVEQYLQANGHLPGVPSEKEIAQKGIDIGEMQKILMEKVEELTLHVIALQKQNIELQNKLSKRGKRQK